MWAWASDVYSPDLQEISSKFVAIHQTRESSHRADDEVSLQSPINENLGTISWIKARNRRVHYEILTHLFAVIVALKEKPHPHQKA